MNFLNPFVLLGLAAAGIPLLLHLLNLRKLRTIEFSSLRFLIELQQTRVRKLKLQQILLLILRTLIVVFAVMAFARPTIQSNLPLLGSEAHASVVILVDNSASMEAADQQGQRFRQAQAAARSIVTGLKDGDEVAVIPLASFDPGKAVSFTRTFAAAKDQIDRMRLADGKADMPSTMRLIRPLLDDALHPHREVYVVSDAQASLVLRDGPDSSAILDRDASVFLVRIGKGTSALEQNISIDSMRVLTQLFQPDKPVEVEAWLRNGSDKDASAIMVSMAFDGVRVAQRALDLPAGGTRSIVLSAPPQRRGLIAVSMELDNDAIDRDNVRYAGIQVPDRARVALVGNLTFAKLALQLPGLGASAPDVTAFALVSDAVATGNAFDVIMIDGGAVTSSDVATLRQYVDNGGGLVLFAADGDASASLASTFGLTLSGPVEASKDDPWQLTHVERAHPLFQGVFKGGNGDVRQVESPRIRRLRPASGGFDLLRTGGGSLLTEVSSGNGRMIYCGVGDDPSWGTFPVTGLFPTVLVRSVSYLVAPRDKGVEARLGEPVTVPVPPRLSGRDRFLLVDATGAATELLPARLPSGPVLAIPAQYRAGVVKVMTPDSAAVMTVSVNAPTDESMLTYLSDEAWKKETAAMVSVPDHVTVLDASRDMMSEIQRARTGSELWPLCIVLALVCALAEMAISRYGVGEEQRPVPATS